MRVRRKQRRKLVVKKKPKRPSLTIVNPDLQVEHPLNTVQRKHNPLNSIQMQNYYNEKEGQSYYKRLHRGVKDYLLRKRFKDLSVYEESDREEESVAGTEIAIMELQDEERKEVVSHGV